MSNISDNDVLSLQKQVEEYGEMESRFISYLQHMSGGALSYSNYELNTMINVSEQVQRDTWTHIHRSDVLDILEDSDWDRNEIIDLVKEYFKD